MRLVAPVGCILEGTADTLTVMEAKTGTVEASHALLPETHLGAGWDTKTMQENLELNIV